MSLSTRVLWATAAAFLVSAIAGCAGMRESARGFVGVSTKEVERVRSSAIIKSFDCDLSRCSGMVEQVLAKMEAYVYARKSGMIAVYISETDTTPVGIFLSADGNTKTKIEVSSPSTYGRETIAEKLFAGIDKELHPELNKEAAGEPPQGQK